MLHNHFVDMVIYFILINRSLIEYKSYNIIHVLTASFDQFNAPLQNIFFLFIYIFYHNWMVVCILFLELIFCSHPSSVRKLLCLILVWSSTVASMLDFVIVCLSTHLLSSCCSLSGSVGSLVVLRAEEQMMIFQKVRFF